MHAYTRKNTHTRTSNLPVCLPQSRRLQPEGAAFVVQAINVMGPGNTRHLLIQHFNLLACESPRKRSIPVWPNVSENTSTFTLGTMGGVLTPCFPSAFSFINAFANHNFQNHLRK